MERKRSSRDDGGGESNMGEMPRRRTARKRAPPPEMEAMQHEHEDKEDNEMRRTARRQPPRAPRKKKPLAAISPPPYDPEEERVRSPDPPRIDRLLTPSPLFFENDNEEDDELQRAIRESREAHRAYMQRMEAARERRRRLAATLALPLSRLRLILSGAHDPAEVHVLRQILHHAVWHTRPEEAEEQSPPSTAPTPEMKEYLERLGRVFSPLIEALYG